MEIEMKCKDCGQNWIEVFGFNPSFEMKAMCPRCTKYERIKHIWVKKVASR